MSTAIIITDLGYGDAGKGSIVDYYVRKTDAKLVIRYNGGPQAAHNVVLPDGRHHTFSQFGSGTFVDGVKTYLSGYMAVDPIAIFEEEKHLQEVGVKDAFSRLIINSGVVLVTPYHRAVNRIRELARGDSKHGSCGCGVGEAIADHHDDSGVLFLRSIDRMRGILKKIRDSKFAQVEWLRKTSPRIEEEMRVFDDDLLIEEFFARCMELFDRGVVVSNFKIEGSVVFEGAQGILLDQDYGFHPHTTWGNTTANNALSMLLNNDPFMNNEYRGGIIKIGVMRAYMTRHGAGPLVTEDVSRCGLSIHKFVEPKKSNHNPTNDWQGRFRYGNLDLVALNYALKVNCGVDALAVTCLDHVVSPWKVCVRYSNLDRIPIIRIRHNDLRDREMQTNVIASAKPEYETVNGADSLCDLIEKELHFPIAVRSTGPTYLDKVAYHEPLGGLDAART